MQAVKEDMVSAMEAVSQGTAVSTAAKAFNVPRRMLDDCVKGRVKHGTKPGPDTVLTDQKRRKLPSCPTWCIWPKEDFF